MNIWIVNQYAVPSNVSGGSRHYYLAKNLVSHGHDVMILAGNFIHQSRIHYKNDWSDSGLEDVDGVRFYWLPTMAYSENGIRRVLGMLAFSLRVAMFRGRRSIGGTPNVIMGSSPNLFAAFAAWILAKRTGASFVLEVRDIWPETLVEMGVGRWNPLVILFGIIEKFLYRRARKIVTLLPGFNNYLKYKFSGKYLEKVIHIPNGVDSCVEPPEQRESSDQFVVSYAGSFGVANALDVILDVADMIRSEPLGKQITFRLVGDGPCRPRLEETKARRGLDNVVFVGSIPKKDVIVELRKADILIATLRDLPLYRWGISLNKVFDYMLAGRPVVFGANSTNNPILDARSGEVVDPENAEQMVKAICKLLHMSLEERHAMGIKGYKFVMKNHLWSVQSRKFEEEILNCV